jgi:ATP-dependent Clp protease protease subunit
VVAVADHRTSAPDTRFHLAQPTERFTGTPEEIAAQSRQQQELLWKLCGSLARRTGQPAEEIAEHMRRGRYLNAREALDYGLIDEITPVKDPAGPGTGVSLFYQCHKSGVRVPS